MLSPAEQLLIFSLDQSAQRLHEEVEQLREENRVGNVDKIAVIRAEITYTRQIQADFLTEVTRTPSRAGATRRRHQQNRQQGGGILTTITNILRVRQAHQPRNDRQNQNDWPILPPREFYSQPMANHHPQSYRRPAHSYPRDGILG